MARPSDAELVQEALKLTQDAPAGDRVRQILEELNRRTAVPRGQQKFVRAWVLGRQARSDGIPLDACPYVEKGERRTFTTAYRKAWVRGWKGMDKGFCMLNLKRASLQQLLRKQRVG